MGHFKNAPNMVHTETGWEIEGFFATGAAHNYYEQKGSPAYVYCFRCGEYLKIGKTTNPKKRLDHYNDARPIDIEVIFLQKVPYAGMAYAEAWLHRQLDEFRIKPEWFKTPPDIALSLKPTMLIAARRYDKECRKWAENNREKWARIRAAA